MPGKDPIDAVNAFTMLLKGLDEEGQVKAYRLPWCASITPAELDYRNR